MERKMKYRIWNRLWQLVFVLALLSGSPVAAQDSTRRILVLAADGPITPAMAEYLVRGIQTAENQGAEALIFEMNTPGGNLDLMNRMVQDIRSSAVPVVVYVSPRGAMAGSAGAVITLAGHASAMAPETAIGAASPVGGEGEDLGKTMQAKQTEILKATVRSLADRRGQEAIDLAQQMIETARAVSASEALQAGVVDFIASDLDDLVAQLDGFTVVTQAGEQVLQTRDAVIQELRISFIERLLAVLTNPNIVFLLIAIGVQAILIEISSPGGWIAGFIGVVCLSLASYGLGVLPVNWFGIIFLVTAFVLFILDIKAPTHGALTVAGVGSLIVGALVLFNSPNVPSFQRVSVPLVIFSSIFTGLVFFTILLFALRAQRTPVRMGQESLVGKTGIVSSELNPRGIVQLAGERWTAEAQNETLPVAVGERIEVVRVEGLRLWVQRANPV
jgi:membrane-bound serine protease (ClpP class)